MSKFSVRELMAAPTEGAIEETTAPQAPAERTIDQITVEINVYKQQTAQGIFEIGRRLIEAKSMLQHGEWLAWLRDRVDFNIQTAQRFMRIAQEYPNASPVTHLSYAKLLALIQVPAEEREGFIAEAHLVDGQEKTVDEMSKRELEAAIRAQKSAEKEAEDARKQAQTAKQKAKMEYDNYMGALVKIEKMEEKALRVEDDRQIRIMELERRIRELEARPVDVAVREMDETEREQLREQLRLELQAEQDAAPVPEEIPPELLEKAAEAFSDAVHASFKSYEAFALASAPANVMEPTEDCITACEDVLDDLHGLYMRAKRVAHEFDDSLPDEDDDYL